MMKRRRFLAISAAAFASPALAQPVRWQGYAMGADVSLTLDADLETARPVIAKMQAILEQCENLFSLYRPDSTLSRLNRSGHLANPAPEFLQLLRACDQIHRITEGRFDPTVQPLWLAEAAATDPTQAQRLVGWDKVSLSPAAVTLGAGQALTLNGIAQGYATDLITSELRQNGWAKVLVNVGEFHAGGRIWTLGISDPEYGVIDTLKLRDRAVATSSPSALRLRSGRFHILAPNGSQAPLWSTVSVQAADATTADALSTAFCHATRAEISNILTHVDGKPSAVCVRLDGSVEKVGI